VGDANQTISGIFLAQYRSMTRKEMSKFTRTFNFSTRLLPITDNFPRAHRYTNANELLDGAFELRAHQEADNHRRGKARMDLKAILSTVCEICNHAFGSTVTTGFLIDASQNALISRASSMNQANKNDLFVDVQYIIPIDFIENIVSESNQAAAIEDIQALDIPGIPYFDQIKENDVRSLAIAGMYQNNALEGMLVIATLGVVREFTGEELALLHGLADLASAAVGNTILFEQVRDSRERQQALARRLVDLQEDERRNLARELHDHLGQMMTGLQFSLSSLVMQASDEQKKKIEDAQKQVGSLIAQTREISINLHPSMLDDTGLILTLIWHFDRFTTQTKIKVNFQHANMLEKRFDAEIEIAVFRIIQEALTNAARYAKVDSIDVMLYLEEQVIKIEISDQGQGFNLNNVDNRSHMGLNGMSERACALGGRLEIQTAPGEGTRIQVIIPLSGNIERRQHER